MRGFFRFLGCSNRVVSHRPQRRRLRKSRPALEGLEGRQLLSSLNGRKWTYGSRITYSFVPDGTSVGGTPSTLFATLNSAAGTSIWQAAFQKAAAYWSSYANINLAQVADNGAPVDTQGDQQDDPRFGDIRISMVPLASNVLAECLLPPAFNGNTDAGDVIFNASMPWQVGNNYDVQTVALHEFGHAFGLDHSAYTTAAMYGYYTGMKQAPTSDDITGIQTAWGVHPVDAINNGSFSTATTLTPDMYGQVALSGLSLCGASDSDYYAVTVPASTTGTMTVSMQATGLSSMAPKLALYNSAHVPLAQASDINGGTATVVVSGVTPGQTYYLRAFASATPGVFGAYGLLVNLGSLPQASIAPPNTTVASQPDQGGGAGTELVGGQGSVAMANNFNGTAVPYNPNGTDNYIWFNSAMKASGIGATSTVTIHVTGQSIDFTNPADGTHYHLAVPDSMLVFSPTTTVATTNFDPASNSWITNLPSANLAGNIFLSGLTFKVPVGGLAGGIKSVAWSGTFTTDTPGVSVNWQWGAAHYNTFSTDYNLLCIKPVDDAHASLYQNTDHAGTPEAFALAGNVLGGATGGGGSNWTGGLSGTAKIAQLTFGNLTAYADALQTRSRIPLHRSRTHHRHKAAAQSVQRGFDRIEDALVSISVKDGHPTHQTGIHPKSPAHFFHGVRRRGTRSH
jgi:hypothetical protein